MDNTHACSSCNLNEPDSVHDRPKPSYDNASKDSLAVGVAEDVTSKFLTKAAPGGTPSTRPWTQDVHDEQDVGLADRHLNHCILPGAGFAFFRDSCLLFDPMSFIWRLNKESC